MSFKLLFHGTMIIFLQDSIPHNVLQMYTGEIHCEGPRQNKTINFIWIGEKSFLHRYISGILLYQISLY